MDKAIIIARCSTNESKQDVKRQTEELQSKYGSNYEIIKRFEYYQSGNKNDLVNTEILEFVLKNGVKHILATELSRISRKISSFALFLEECNENKINIIIDNYNLHTLTKEGKPNTMVQTMLSIASTFAAMELSLIKSRLDSGRELYIKNGGKLGRKKGSFKTEQTLLEEHRDIVKFLRQGQSIRNTMKLSGKSSGTVQKIKKLLEK